MPQQSNQGLAARPITGSGNLDQPLTLMQQLFGDVGMPSAGSSHSGGQASVGLPPAAISGSADSNLSFFSDSQLNPGVIQPPSRSDKPTEGTSVGSAGAEEDAARMSYTQDLGLTGLGVPDARQRTGSQRYKMNLFYTHLESNSN